MKDLTYDAENNLAELKAALEKVDAFLAGAPNGHLNISSRKDKHYYQQITGDYSAPARRRIPKENSKLINDLSDKGYYVRVRPKILDEISSLSTFLNSYHPKEKDKEYTKMSPVRKSLTDPLFPNIDSTLQMWDSMPSSKFEGYGSGPKYLTNKNEVVRSKSEVIIANELNNAKDKLLYRYEPALYLSESATTFRPDFGIVNLESGNIYYWEHAGMMDNPEYANNFVSKITRYLAEGFEIGKDLILTFESSQYPLNTSIIKKTISNLI